MADANESSVSAVVKFPSSSGPCSECAMTYSEGRSLLTDASLLPCSTQYTLVYTATSDYYRHAGFSVGRAQTRVSSVERFISMPNVLCREVH